MDLPTPTDTEEEDEKYKKKIPEGKYGFFVVLSSWWCANAICLAACTSVLWPAQISAVVNDPNKEDLYNGFIPSLGAFVSMIITPIAGSLSDHSTNKYGRRMVYIVSGSIIAIAFMLAMGAFHRGSPFNSIYVLMVMMMGFQFGLNWAGGPYAGLMPDLVPMKKFGLASGFLGLAIAIGQLIGALGTGFLAKDTDYFPAYIFTVAVFIFFSLFTVFGIKEIPRPPPKTPFSLRKLVSEFYLEPEKYKDFYWIILTRFFDDMGVYAILPFFQYFYKDIFHKEDPAAWSSYTVAIIVVVSIPATITAGYLSDKYGKKPIVYLSTLIQAIGCLCLILVAIYPSLVAALVLAGVIGSGYGAYQAVDWALALSVLPEGANVAKDMGVWHLAFILPQVISPVISGAILQTVKEHSVHGAYAVLFATVAFWYLMATIFIYPVNTKRMQKIPSSS